jgi:hypothetical protein
MRLILPLSSLALAAVVVMPLAAQGGMGRGDPTNTVQGTGVLPKGWELRFDPARGRQPAPPMTAVSFVTMGTGFHITGGPAAIYFRTADVEKGNFTVTAKFVAAKSMVNEAYGVFIGGQHLQDSTQSYLYLVIRPKDGGVYIQHRGSDARPSAAAALLPWTPNAAVNKDDPADGHSTNEVGIQTTKDSVLFWVNGKHVFGLARAALNGIATDGQVGMRVNHNIDIHVDNFTVKK